MQMRIIQSVIVYSEKMMKYAGNYSFLQFLFD